MERRLLRGITTPAMIVTIALGVTLGLVQGQWSAGWLHLKTVLVLGLAGVHGALAHYLKAFAADRRPASERFFRWLNELPTLLFVAIVLVVVLRPF
jgi:putative membrane protein